MNSPRPDKTKKRGLKRLLPALGALPILALIAPGVPACAYGPQICDAGDLPDACEDDQECIDEYGEDWYCEEEEFYWDECGAGHEIPFCTDGAEES